MLKNKPPRNTRMCSYCFAHFKAAEAPFRCVAVPQVCPPDLDEAYSKFWGQQALQLLGKVFMPKATLKWQRHKLEPENCPCCATPTTVRLCPQCHNSLDPHFQIAQDFSIMVVVEDPDQATNFLQDLQDKLRKMVAHDLGFLTHFYPDRPFDIHLEKLNQKQPYRLHLHFYPVTPKELVPSNPWYQKLLAHTEGVIILVDGPALQTHSQSLETILEKLCTETIPVPTVVALQGLSTMVPFLPPHSLILDLPKHIKGIHLNNVLQASNEIMGYLGSWGHINILHLMRTYMPNRLLSYGDKTLRLEDGLLWLLHQWGKVGKAVGKD